MESKNVFYLFRLWWKGSSILKRVLIIGGVLLAGLIAAVVFNVLVLFGVLLAGLIAAVVFSVRYLLSPADSIDDYAKYYRNDTAPIQDGDVAITFFGVSTLLFDDGETQILVDSFFTRPPVLDVLSKMQSNEDEVARFIKDYNLDRVRAAFIAHSHYDHALDVPAVAKMTGATIYGTESTMNIGRGGGVAESQLALAKSGDSVQIGDFAVRIEESPHSIHPGVPAPDYPPTIDKPLVQPASNAEFACGGNFNFIITHGDKTYVVVASANYRDGSLAGTGADVLFLGTATLGLRDEAFQQKYLDETIGLTTPEIVIPLHWDDFVKPWVKDGARFNPRIIDAEPAKGIAAVIERTNQLGANFNILQAGSRLVVPQ